jgi:transglutaminase-like putative cysteine protease
VKLRVGYELQYEFPQPTPLIAMLNVHFSRVADLAAPDHIVISPSVPISCYRDGFGNWCSRIVAPAGHVRLSTDAVVTDSGLPDPVAPDAGQIAVEKLPEEAIVFLSQVVSATAIDCWILPGHCSRIRPQAGRASKQSAIS